MKLKAYRVECCGFLGDVAHQTGAKARAMAALGAKDANYRYPWRGLSSRRLPERDAEAGKMAQPGWLPELEP